jgi:hypothetical protein
VDDAFFIHPWRQRAGAVERRGSRSAADDAWWKTLRGLPPYSLRVEAAGDYFANGEVRRTLSLNQQWEVRQNLGLRLSAERQFSQLSSPQNEVMLELKWHHY